MITVGLRDTEMKVPETLIVVVKEIGKIVLIHQPKDQIIYLKHTVNYLNKERKNQRKFVGFNLLISRRYQNNYHHLLGLILNQSRYHRKYP